MKENVLKALNDQINFEISSAYLYLAMSIAMHDQNYKGYANWLFKQYREELVHAEDFIAFVQKRDSTVTLDVVKKPEVAITDPLELAKAVLAHEQKVTKAIYTLHDLAKKEDDYASEIFLHTYISEQTEEEDSAQDIIDKFSFAGSSTAARYAVDRELAGRE